MNTITHLYQEFLLSSGITTDSRKADKNMLYFALKGDSFDGNRFAIDSVSKGCRLAIIDEEDAIESVPDLEKQKYFLVENCLEALQDLARHHRDRLKTTIIGITGSNGKTTTKELIFNVLAQKFKVRATEGNLNNHIGVPLSLLKLRDEDFGIIEMGANHIGEIDFLCHISKPSYGIITNIGKAHLEGFGSLEGVKKAKSELYRYLGKNKGTAFIHAGNDNLMKLSDIRNLNKIFYGAGNESLCDGKILESDRLLKVEIFSQKEKVKEEAKIKLTGSYNLENILAAACIGIFFGLEVSEIIRGLENYNTSSNRSQYLKTLNNQVILDAYNANPTSMMESVRNFMGHKYKNKVLILGDMLELGKYSEREHKRILIEINKFPSVNVFLVGSEFYSFRNDFDYTFFRSTEDLINFLKTNAVRKSYILLKASRGIALEKIIKIL